MFIVNNLQSDYEDIYIGDEFVESLHDTLKIRDKFLSELVSEVDEIVHPRETFEEWMAKQKSPEQVEDATAELSPKIPCNPDAGRPKFNHQYIDNFFATHKDLFFRRTFQPTCRTDGGVPAGFRLQVKEDLFGFFTFDYREKFVVEFTEAAKMGKNQYR